MKFEFEVGTNEKHLITFSRNWLTGSMSFKSDGRELFSQNALNPTTHVSVTLVHSHTVAVGISEHHVIRIERERPLLMAGFRPHSYRVFIDDRLIQARRGY